MKFQVKPVLTLIKGLYEQPLTPDRFQNYLAQLQGSSKGDLQLPIGGFNPMAKEHIMTKIAELEALRAEEIMQEALNEINTKRSDSNVRIECVLNLADDLMGGWTNRYTTDFDSKFKLNALVERNFSTPYFWSSESYTEDLIQKRTKANALRTLYWKENGKIQCLRDYIKQESFVWTELDPSRQSLIDLKKRASIVKDFEEEDDYSFLFNFFYGDAASESLAYPTFDLDLKNGFPFYDS